MTKLTTHVLDVYSGKPGKDIKVDLYHIRNNKREKLISVMLNNDGRADKPLIEGPDFKEGQYELVFFVGGYFKKITELPKNEWAGVVEDSKEFWDETSKISPRCAKVVDAFNKYADTMVKAGYPYR